MLFLMKPLLDMTRAELEAFRSACLSEYQQFQTRGLKLDISRGKPSPRQMDLTAPMLDVLNSGSDLHAQNGLDCRNYGMLEGIPEARALFAEMLGVSTEEILVGGNSSLNLMFDTVASAYTHGILGETPWCKLDQVKFLCPVPGYDRHFAVTEYFGIEMICVPMTPDGPDMNLVETLVSEDDSIKGIWCVPRYSNPDGCVYSDETVRRFAALKPAAKDFRIYWDHAYCMHHLTETPKPQLNLMDAAKAAGNPNLPFMFASTSKITFSGSGVAVFAASSENLADFKKCMQIRTIGYDKVNQLRHVRFFKDFAGMQAHMELHAQLLRPKFDLVIETLERELTPLGIGQWKRPEGGYFISFNGPDGSAKRIASLCKEAGLVLTGAGATYPYGKDPADRNIRIAPTYPELEELQQAMTLFCLCVKLAAAELMLS